MISFYKSQKDVAQALKLLIDDYWELKIEEEIFINRLNQIIANNQDIVFKENNFTSQVKQRLGKKRTELILRITEGVKNK